VQVPSGFALTAAMLVSDDLHAGAAAEPISSLLVLKAVAFTEKLELAAKLCTYCLWKQ
jgi:hypothetical protein